MTLMQLSLCKFAKSTKIEVQSSIAFVLLEVSKTFDMLDIDKDGRLSRVELAILLRTIKIEPSSRDLDFIVNEMDRESK